MNAPERHLTIPAIGTQLAGGTVLGHLFVDGAPVALIVPAKAARENPAIIWNADKTRVTGALSLINGLANTRAMAEAGSPLAKWAMEQRIDGHDDWYIGSRLEMLTIYSNLKLAGDAYQKDGAEAFDTEDAYWTSTQGEWSVAYAWLQWFDDGDQFYSHKSFQYRAFVLRREPIR